MPRLTKITTRQGDQGLTRLSGGQEVPKDALRVSAYGTVDELNSQIGVALAVGLSPRLQEVLPKIQNELFHLGSDLSFREADKEKYAVPQIETRHVDQLDALIDEMNAELGQLENFILPGGSMGAAQLHVARTVCRRAERCVISLTHTETVGLYVIPYLNRLSDVLFMLARYENKICEIPDPLWDSHA
ncbi:MAG: cob(I)yrinic acid a,c-diamide adenosyltransferase [Anaerolineales bacterium]|nr:cob(I)yrinic acid a,c-diamide adenosyltransferase [Anaerolineales bacterium]